MLKHIGNIAIIGGTLLIMGAAFLTGYNIYEGKQAEAAAEEITTQLQAYLIQYNEYEQDTDTNPENVSDSVRQDVCVIDDMSYIGILDIPSLQLSLPVCADFSYPNLKKAPCVYQGNIHSNDIIIAGHNYERHFGQLKYLNVQDQVVLHTIDNVDRLYYVADSSVYDKFDIDKLMADDEDSWDLTLFTCTIGGENRYIIRCKLN